MEQKPSQKEVPVWSILPSYDMYQRLNGRTGPPKYDDTTSIRESSNSASTNSSQGPIDSTGIISYENLSDIEARDNASMNSNPSLIVADESTNAWRETLLDNIENLRNYSTPKNPYTHNIELSIHFTEDVGKQGVAPKHIDPSQYEYKQGDYLNGYIYIKNKYPISIPFDMFYVLFEGTFTVKSKTYTTESSRIKIKKYLEMYDPAASWNEARVDRLVSEKYDNQFSYPHVVDPNDGARIFIAGRQLSPGALYKRFFTFKIPDRLLDTECNDHNLSSHTFLPPTLGLSDKEKLLTGKIYENSNDFSFFGTSTSYGILARFIGKASDFNVNEKFDLPTKLIDGRGDEYIIFRECRSFVRVVPEANVLNKAERQVNTETARILYDNLLGRIKEKIAVGNRVKEAIIAGNPLENMTSVDLSVSTSDDHKARQLYTRLDDLSKSTKLKFHRQENYVVSVPLIKRRLLGSVKSQGMLQITSPKTEYILNYMSPEKFRANNSKPKHFWHLEIPITIEFLPTDVSQTSKVPYITKITPELVVFTMKAGKYPAPIEITHDHLFKNQSSKIVDLKSVDNFENIVQIPMRRYAAELYDIIRTAGPESFNVERSLLEDIHALASLETKTDYLQLRDSKLAFNDGTSISLEGAIQLGMDFKNGAYSKDISITLDAAKAQKSTTGQDKLPADYSSADEFCLVPSFQNCNIARLYYIRLLFQLSSGEVIELKLPLTIAKFPSN